MFIRDHPTKSAGDGQILDFSADKGEGQGKKTNVKLVHCKQCGCTVDINATDHSGGTRNGDGGYGTITKTLTTHGYYGDRDVRRGAGCPSCGSKNII